ncbi:TetR/AcrR family transcriptional regulator [Aggregicoccus sp. 17bor-14]|uniref:TetR/AcrR family transcriptional regulator n=1 Tax=Myxococcaceae TaxID=31 RepID=UPI00129CA420|nr:MULTISPECIES: TetR/AcrR family transcriptional regulator [Myxococcaceae]MBF5044989.1 TetR/AcrR family transcriptional regulator [Simulacricoccus sp. 17bor-14]MRI90732.1 TetR/AcrR family transcriptional regulator [Aggregicoccus sp. 17bor-14]
MSEARDRILAAARALFLSGGAEALTMRAVAERVGVTATALYRHFEGKEALLEAVMREGHALFGSYLYRSLEVRGGPWERLQDSGERYLEFALQQPEAYRTLFMQPAQPCEPGEREPPGGAATFRFLVDRVRECMDAGLLREDGPDAVALAIWAHVHGLVSLHLSGALGVEEPAFREAYRASVRRLFAGLAP